MRIIRLLHITATHLGPKGGIPVVLRELITEQNKLAGFEARLLSLHSNLEDNICEYFYDISKISENQYIKEYAPNIVIIHSFFHAEYIHLSNLLNKYQIPYYIEPHGSFVRSAFQKSRIKKTIANTTIFRKLIRGAFGYIYLCKEERINSIYQTNNDLIIPNGIHISRLSGKKYDNIRLYYIGRYDIVQKGINTLLDALEIIDNKGLYIDFDFFGGGSEKDIGYINRRIKKFKNIRVRNRGEIYGKEKEDTLSKYNIMVLVSQHEGFPMTILEAWEMGTPCIVSYETNVGKVAEDNNIGWATHLNRFEISKRIISSIEDYNQNRKQYIKNTKDYVDKFHRWNKVAELSKDLLLQKLS